MEIRRFKTNAEIGIEQLEELLAGLHYQKKEYVALPGISPEFLNFVTIRRAELAAL